MRNTVKVFKKEAFALNEFKIGDALFDLVHEKIDSIPNLQLDNAQLLKARRDWKWQTEEKRRLLREVPPRFALNSEQVDKILAEDRAKNGITVNLEVIADNPYILSEQYQGDDPDDLIPWGAIDRGMMPCPSWGARLLPGLATDEGSALYS